MPLRVEDYLPAVLTVGSLTEDDFAKICSEHPDLFFEMTAEGELIVMPPNYTLTSGRNREVLEQLSRWARQDGRGIVTDASGGFVLPNGAIRAPDAAWILRSRVRQLDRKMIERYWHLCPDFVIEVRSHTDRLRTLREKMQEWIDNGAQLGWMLDPRRRAVEIYRPGREPEERSGEEPLAGEGSVEGFVLVLAPVWDPLG